MKEQYIKVDNLFKNYLFLQKWVFTRFFKNNERVFEIKTEFTGSISCFK